MAKLTEEANMSFQIVDTHGQSPWHFTGQALLDLNADAPTSSSIFGKSTSNKRIVSIQELTFTHGQSPWNSALRVIR